MICNKCYRIISDDSKFCPYCGNKIEKNEPIDNVDIVESEISEDSDSDITEISLEDILNFHAKATVEVMKANAETQPDNEGDEDFGLVPEKPIFTLAIKSVDGEEEYLDKLRTTCGERIIYNRRGSISAEGVNGMVDIYDIYLPSGEFYKTIYINMYGAKASTSAPKGFYCFNSSEKTSVCSQKRVSKFRNAITKMWGKIRAVKKSHLIIGSIITLIMTVLIALFCLAWNGKLFYKWYDADGTLLYQENLFLYQFSGDYELPEDTEKWDYIEWRTGETKNEIIAYREPKASYLVGNVFQIVVKDLGGTPLATGSAFVFNDEGWFITNAHVMENAYYAQAIFNIPNKSTGESFTYFDINSGTYYHYDKDIYIGKIDSYSSIKSYYKPIAIETNYEIGETTYSVGYPNSATELVINSGEVTETWSNIYDKLYSGNTYICSSSYIAPGSSGGVLINGNFDVIGLTTLGWTNDNGSFISGASISAFNFENILQNTGTTALSLQDRFHSDKKTYIDFFNSAKEDCENGEAEKNVLEDGTVYYTYTWNDEGVNDDGDDYTYVTKFSVAADGFISVLSEWYWGSGDSRTVELYGYYNHKTGLSDLIFEFYYEWSNGNSYTVTCDKINYSPTVSLTLNKCVDKGYGFTPTSDNITYAKENFNGWYEWLDEML